LGEGIRFSPRHVEGRATHALSWMGSIPDIWRTLRFVTADMDIRVTAAVAHYQSITARYDCRPMCDAVARDWATEPSE
jgi:hypothetical protein